MIDQRIGSVAALVDFRDDAARQGRDVIRLPGHTEVGTDQVDVELDPGRRPDDGGNRETEGLLAARRHPDFEAKPIAHVQGRGPAQVCLGYFSPHFPVQVDVEAAAHPKVAGEQSGCPFTTQPSSTG
jgi:hypothetical protein